MSHVKVAAHLMELDGDVVAREMAFEVSSTGAAALDGISVCMCVVVAARSSVMS